jgi:hypothetical protein
VAPALLPTAAVGPSGGNGSKEGDETLPSFWGLATLSAILTKDIQDTTREARMHAIALWLAGGSFKGGWQDIVGGILNQPPEDVPEAADAVHAAIRHGHRFTYHGAPYSVGRWLRELLGEDSERPQADEDQMYLDVAQKAGLTPDTLRLPLDAEEINLYAILEKLWQQQHPGGANGAAKNTDGVVSRLLRFVQGNYYHIFRCEDWKTIKPSAVFAACARIVCSSAQPRWAWLTADTDTVHCADIP